jgi:hypothetical protein
MKRIHLFFFFLFCNILNTVFAQLPPDFVETVVTDEIYRPVGIAFDDNGRSYVWERNGVVHIIDSSGVKLLNPLVDISEEVGNWGDHGCLAFALHPDFLSNGYFYLLYVVDRHHLLYFGTSQYEPDSSLTKSFSRRNDRNGLSNFDSFTWCGIVGFRNRWYAVGFLRRWR